MMAKYYNRFTRQHEEYQIPDGWRVSAYEADLDTMVNCPHCGEQFPAKEGYTSMEIYTDNGLWGMMVHEKCYQQEWQRRREAEMES